MTMLQTAALSFIKISCLLFFRRIFRAGSSKVFDIALWVMLSVVIVWGFSFVFGFMFICRTHFNWSWTSVDNSLKCGNLKITNQSLSLSDVIMDFLIMIFPLPLVRWTKSGLAGRKLTLGRFGGCKCR